MYTRISPQHRQTDKRMFRTERDGAMQVIGGPFHESRGHLYRRETGYWLFAAGSPRQLDVGDVVKVELLDFADEVRYGGRHAYFLF